MQANSSGRTGRTQVNGSGCGSCHGSAKSDNTTLKVTSETGSFNVAPGSTTVFTLEVAHGSHTRAGCNIAVKTTESGSTDAGDLAAVTGSGLKSSGDELTHSAKKALSGGTVEFEFEWTAPTAPGDYYIRAIGNAVNNNGNSDSGDDWNWLAPVKVTVQAVPSITLSAPLAGGVFCPDSDVTIEWESTMVDNVKIELSDNGGQSYTTVITNSTPASSGSFVWSIPSAQPADADYRIRVSDAADADVNDAMTGNFAIADAPTITMQPIAIQRCEGGTAVFEVQADGAGLSFQWRKDGTPIAGAENIMLTLSGLTPDDAGDYDVIVIGACDDQVISDAATLTIDEQPAITVQPQAANACAGDMILLEVTATGTDIGFSWEKDGQPVPNATGPRLEIGSATPGDAGTYVVIVSGACSPAVSSQETIVTVGLPPTITSHSESRAICEGANVTLEAQAEGNFTYAWTKDGNAIAGGDLALLSILSADASDAGTYQVTVSGPCGADAVSEPIIISVTGVPQITMESGGAQVDEGNSVTLSVTASGDDLMYRWRRDGTVLDEEIESTLTIESVTPADAGGYTCIVSNDCGQVVSGSMDVMVTPLADGPAIGTSTTLLDYGELLVGFGRPVPFMLKNIGDAPLEITAINSNAGDFSIDSPTDLPFTIAPNAEREIAVRYTPATVGEHTGRISFSSNAVNPGTGVSVRGIGLAAIASVFSLEFDEAVVDGPVVERTFRVNAGDLPARVSAFEFAEGAEGAYELVEMLPLDVAAGESGNLTVRFAPPAAGDFSGVLRLTVDDQPTTLDVILNGTGRVGTSVRFDAELADAITVMPNPLPAAGIGVIDLALPGQFEVRIVDLNGVTLRQVQLNGPVRWQFDGRDAGGRELAAGYYRLVVDNGTGFTTVPLILR